MDAAIFYGLFKLDHQKALRAGLLFISNLLVGMQFPVKPVMK